MRLQLVERVEYAGNSGVLQVRALQDALNTALEHEDWAMVRRLDQSCAALIDKVIAANKDDTRTLLQALSELKDVYASLIVECKREVASLAS